MADNYNLSVAASELNSAITKANAAAPQSTTYTKAQVDAAIASEATTRQTADNTTNAALTHLVNTSAKNLIKIGFDTFEAIGITLTHNPDGSITINGESTKTSQWILVYDLANEAASSSFENTNTLPNGDYIMKGTDDASVRVQLMGFNSSDDYSLLSNTSSDKNITINGTWAYYVFRVWVAGSAVFDNLKIYPMLCRVEDYAISPDFVQYAPTLSELYQMVKALQGGNA